MPVCLACDGTAQQYVDWADDYASCIHCTNGQVTEREHRLQQRQAAKHRRKMLKRNPPRTGHTPYKGYRIQQVSLQWTDYDTIGSVSWETIRVVETLDYGVRLVNEMNERDAPYCDYGPPYRLVSPNSRVVDRLGGEGGRAYASTHYPVPGEY